MDIYSILKEKANDAGFKNMIIYYDMEVNKSYSFSDVFNLVNYYLNVFSNLDIKGKIKYLIVDNSVDSVALFIALLRTGAIPILINKSDLVYNGNNYPDYISELNNKINYEEQLSNLKYDFIIANDVNTFLDENETLYKITNYIDKIEKVNNYDGDFYICTSGVTNGIGKLISLSEKELIKRSLTSDKDYSILTTVSISAISGILSSVCQPIINNVKNYMVYDLFKKNNEDRFLKMISYYGIKRVLLPRNILDLLTDELKQYDFSCLDTVYLTGEVSNYETINKILSYFPNLSIKNIVSMYGRTENYGTICSCRGDKIRSLYVNVLESNENELIYTYDKEHIYKLSFNNGQKIIEEVNMKYNQIFYANYLSVSENILDNINTDSNSIVSEIIVDGKNTGDLGIYLDNQLYVLGRKDDLVSINGTKYLLSMYEQMFGNFSGLKAAAIVNETTNKMFVALNYNIDPKLIDNFKRLIPLSKRCNKIIDQFSLPIEYPLFLSSDSFPKNNLMRKTKKNELRNMIDKNIDFQKYVNNYVDSFVNVIDRIITEQLHKKVSISYRNNEFVFSKKEISFYELCDLERDILGFYHFREDDENIYLKIDDCILFNKYPDFNYMNNLWLEDKIEYIRNQYNFLDSNKFTKFYNHLKNRNIHYQNIKLFGIMVNENDYYKFVPYQLASDNNYHVSSDKIKGSNLPFIKSSNESIMMVYLDTEIDGYYTNKKFNNKINEFSPLLDHVYRIKKSDGTFYIDNQIANKNNKIYKEMRDNALFNSFNYRFYYSHIYGENNLVNYLNDNNLIILDNEKDVQRIINTLSNYDIIDLYGCFKIYGIANKIELNYEDKINHLIYGIIMSSSINHLDDLGVIVYTNHFNELKFCDNPNMELFNIVKKQTIKIIRNVIEDIRKQGKKELLIDGKLREIDLSKVKLVLVGIGEDNETIDYISEIIDDCSIISIGKKNKELSKNRRI